MASTVLCLCLLSLGLPPLLLSIIQMSSWHYAQLLPAVISLTDALQFDFRSSLTINTIPYKDKFQDQKIYLEWKISKVCQKIHLLDYWTNAPLYIAFYLRFLPPHTNFLLTPFGRIGLLDCFWKNRRKSFRTSQPTCFWWIGVNICQANYSWMMLRIIARSGAEGYWGRSHPHPLREIVKCANRPDQSLL